MMVGIFSLQRYVPSYLLPWLYCCLCNHTSGVSWRRSREHGGENPPGICEARCLSLLQRALRFARRVPLARGMSDNEALSLFWKDTLWRVPSTGRLGAFGAFEAVRRGFLQPPLSLTRRAPPGAGRDPLEEMYGVRMVDLESLFFVLIETFGSCDSQLDCFTALRGTDSLPTLLCVGGWRVVVRMGLCLKDKSTAGTDMTCQILFDKIFGCQCRFACLLCKCSLCLGLGRKSVVQIFVERENSRGIRPANWCESFPLFGRPWWAHGIFAFAALAPGFEAGSWVARIGFGLSPFVMQKGWFAFPSSVSLDIIPVSLQMMALPPLKPLRLAARPYFSLGGFFCATSERSVFCSFAGKKRM
ncbi:hypothetical protein PAPYR_12500 [Paratrimastix pyriformis]|uniref:Uncharacterized protein n=1 Tax=Paratrimastix pyriformis TaxID=342808 RepID=A0ABQ8U1S9_9EUKA|nr:hypothetical protein PAPYR_12500 [Paratrimastix pyriformis]